MGSIDDGERKQAEEGNHNGNLELGIGEKRNSYSEADKGIGNTGGDAGRAVRRAEKANYLTLQTDSGVGMMKNEKKWEGREEDTGRGGGGNFPWNQKIMTE